MIAFKYTFVLLLLFCFRDSTCNNNFDPCSNPANQNLTVPFREASGGSSTISTLRGRQMLFYDTTNCYLLRSSYYSVSQNQDVVPMTFYLNFGGSLEHICNGNTTIGSVGFTDTFPTTNSLITYPKSFNYVTVASVNVRGEYANNGEFSLINATFGENVFSSNATIPSSRSQGDGLFTYDNSPCTIRTRGDTVRLNNLLYSNSAPVDIHFANGTTLHFIFPANIMLQAYDNQAKNYYQQCTCFQATEQTQLTSAEQARFTPPNAVGR